MRSSFPTYLELSIISYSAWQSADLPLAWSSTPAVKYAWIAFLLWCAPVVWYCWICIVEQRVKKSQTLMLCFAIFVSLIGTLGSLHILKHMGLALAIAALAPTYTLMWIGSMAAWLPGFGWILRNLPFILLPAIQMLVAAVGACSLFYQLRRFNIE